MSVTLPINVDDLVFVTGKATIAGSLPKAYRVTEVIDDRWIIARRGKRTVVRVDATAIVGWSRGWVGYGQRQPVPDHVTFLRGRAQSRNYRTGKTTRKIDLED